MTSTVSIVGVGGTERMTEFFEERGLNCRPFHNGSEFTNHFIVHIDDKRLYIEKYNNIGYLKSSMDNNSLKIPFITINHSTTYPTHTGNNSLIFKEHAGTTGAIVPFTCQPT